jgi:hypothetical protein
MRRVGYRHVLPPAQVVLFGVLCLTAYWDRLGQQPCMYIDTYGNAPVFAQEGPGIPPFGLHPPCHEPAAQVIAMCLNSPAVFVGLLIEPTLLHSGLEPEASFFFASAPAVLLLWYSIGRWIDRRLGYVGLPKGHRSFPRVLAKVAFGCSVFILFLSAIVLAHSVYSHHHRWDDVVVASGFVGWSVFLTAVTWANFRRTHPPLSADPQAQSPHP